MPKATYAVSTEVGMPYSMEGEELRSKLQLIQTEMEKEEKVIKVEKE